MNASDADPDCDDSTANVQIMILGTYHMNGGGLDVVNIDMGSVLTPQKQAELEELAQALKSFRPTAVVTERVTQAPAYLDPQFQKFSRAQLLEIPDERVQVAMRLADGAGVTRVYGIDEQPTDSEPDYFPFGEVLAQAEHSGRAGELQDFLDDMRGQAEQQAASSANDHVALQLLQSNLNVEELAKFYYGLAAFDLGEAQPGAELQAYWFMRNTKIWSKIMNIAEPGDRIVVVYGAGHKFWLDHLVQHTPGFDLVDPVPYLRAAAASAPLR